MWQLLLLKWKLWWMSFRGHSNQEHALQWAKHNTVQHDLYKMVIRRWHIKTTVIHLIRSQWQWNTAKTVWEKHKKPWTLSLRLGFENHLTSLHLYISSCFNHVINAIHHTIVLWARSSTLSAAAAAAGLDKTRSVSKNTSAILWILSEEATSS